MVYALEEEQLLILLKQAYEQGVYGHFDLAQSVAESLLESCKDRQLTNPYYKPDYLDSPLNLQLEEELETEGARLDPIMVENIFPAARMDGIMTEVQYHEHGHHSPPTPQDAEWETVTIPGGNPGVQIRVSSGHQIELVDHPIESEVANSNQEGFHWEPYSLAGGNLTIREVSNESEESRKRLRG